MRDGTFRFGDVVVEGAAREVWRAGARVALEPKALDVLLLLLREAGRVVEKRRLIAEVWADVHVTDSSLARAVTQVRRAIGDDHRQPRFVETVPTRGYKFIGVLSPSAADTGAAGEPRPAAGEPTLPAAPFAETPAPLAARTPGRARHRRWWAAMAAALVIVATGGLAAWLRLAPGASAAGADVGTRLVHAATHTAMQLTTSRGADIDPTFSPDGASVAYASDESGAFEIMVRPRHAAAPARTVTTNGGDNVAPVWSPDGQWLAFHSRRFGGVWIVPAAGGTPRQLVPDGAAPSWSPDGRELVFQTAGEGDVLGGTGGSLSTLAIVDVRSGAIRSLTSRGRPVGSHGRPVWLAPDRIVFVATNVPAADAWQVTRAGAVTRIGGCDPLCRPFVFKRDGRSWVGVVNSRARASLFLAPVDAEGNIDLSAASRTMLPATGRVSDVAVSADGRHIAFTGATRTSEVWSVDLEDGDVTRPRPAQVLLAERRPRYSELAFSPDGQTVAYTTSRAGDRAETWLLDLRTGASRQLVTSFDGIVKGWAPDGRGVLLVDITGVLAVHRVDIVTGRASPVARFDTWRALADGARRLFTLRLSPDLRRAFYTAEADGRPSLWITNLERPDAGPERLDGPLEGASFGRWSRDGRRIAFQASDDWRMRLAVHDLAGGQSRVIARDADHAWPNDWSPTDSHVVFAAMRAGRWTIDVADARSGETRSLIPPGGPAEYVRWPVWSPVGDRIVYERGYWTGNVWVATLPES